MPFEISRVQAICFDVDGTLWDSDDEFVLKLAGFLRPIRAFLPKKDALYAARRIVMSLETPGNYIYNLRYRAKVLDAIINSLNKLTAMHHASSSSPRLMIKGVDVMLSALAKRYPLAIVSNRPEKSTIEFLAHNNLLPHFQFVVTGQTCRRAKPNPDPILYAARRLGVSPDNCLMVGDTTVDILAGCRAGAQTAAVLCGFGEEDELRRAGADLILNSSADLRLIMDPEVSDFSTRI